MEETYQKIFRLLEEIKLFFTELASFVVVKLHLSFLRMEKGKGLFVSALYRQRGKLARRLIHSGMAGLAGLGMIIAPVVSQEFPGRSVDPWEVTVAGSVLSATTENSQTQTLISEKVRDKIIDYQVQEGESVSSIAEKFGVSEESILWQNDLTKTSKIKAGETLEILPVTGISHKVQKGDTVYSIAKKYDTSPQGIVDFPYNTFTNDETFELAIGQVVIVPDGVPPKVAPARIRQLTPDAGTVVASGSFIWPAGGYISQPFSWYHKGIDIANKAGPNVLAADSGTVVGAGWLDGFGYGNRVIIDHGNGFKTLYAHLASVYVVPGQTVARGDAIGRMGSTGRSTGTHLHFEVIRNGGYLSPLSVLQ